MQCELLEGLRVFVSLDNLQFSSLIQKNDLETGLVYMNAYFVINKFEGVPKIMEPQKTLS